MRNEAGGQYNELMSSLAVIDELEVLADNYKSFMDNTNNQNSRVQFLLRTEGIQMDRTKKRTLPEERKIMWESIIVFPKIFNRPPNIGFILHHAGKGVKLTKSNILQIRWWLD